MSDSIFNNIGESLDSQFENHNYLPQRLNLEDQGAGLIDLINELNFSVIFEDGVLRKVPLIYLSQELWAERKVNWSAMRGENGEELLRPFMVLARTSVGPGKTPLKYRIPNKKFTFVKVPYFDSSLKGCFIYKIPQPVYTDIKFELSFITHYMEDVDRFYEIILQSAYSTGQNYMFINGYYIATSIEDPSEDNAVDDIKSERLYKITFPITINGKLIDPTQFEKVNAINKISIKISEK